MNVFGTYSHGPVLPKNPEFCDHILETAFRRRDDSFRLPPLDDAVERAAHDAMVKRVVGQSK